MGLCALFSNPAALRHGEASGELMQGWALVDRKAGKRQSWRCCQEVEAVSITRKEVEAGWSRSMGGGAFLVNGVRGQI